MNIEKISKENREVTVRLDADELVLICNAFYVQYKGKGSEDSFFKLYSDMMIARDLCQYGNIDNFCLRNIIKCRNEIGEGLNGLLCSEDREIFNSYLEDNDIPNAFQNSDWIEIYKKIVGNRCTDKLKSWMKPSK